MAKIPRRGGRTEATGRCRCCGTTTPAHTLDALNRCAACVDQLDLFSPAELWAADHTKGSNPT